MSDLIDRQAAIDWCLEGLNNIPSAQSEQPRGKWIYHIDDLFPAEGTKECDQCHAEQPLACDDEFCPHCGAKMEVNRMDDKLITKDAITVLRNLQDWLYYSSMNGGTAIQREAIDIAIGALEQPKAGKWIHISEEMWKCDQCGNYLDFSGVNAGRGDANFCPNCGAKMEVTGGDGMSVLIKGMEMPKCCYDCPLIQASVTGDFYCAVGDGIEEDLKKLYERRMSVCPLVEVKEPHGRLIDADELANKTFYSKTSAPYITYKTFCNAPTVIEAEGREVTE